MPLLFLLFVVVPIAELYVIIQVGQAIGILPTVAILLLDSVVGTWLLRQQGRIAWRRFNDAITARPPRPPAQETIDGGLILLGGAFLLTPGFLSDVLGVVLLLPPTRAVVRRVLARRFMGRMVSGMASRRQTSSRQYDVDGTAHDV